MKKEEVNKKLNEIYNFTLKFIEENGYSPTVRDICRDLNIKSTATAYSYLEKLNSNGLLQKLPFKKRALIIKNKKNDFKSIPIIGTITAGLPIYAYENLEGYCPLPDDFDKTEDCFALKVKGESMIDAGIFNNDTIIVKKQDTANNGDIVVALIDDSATVKRFYKKDGYFVLHPENDKMEDMIFNDLTILGIVKGLYRKI